MNPILNDKNQGRDATIDPAYLARVRATNGSEQDVIEQLQREVVQLKIQLNALQNQYNVISEQLEQATGEIDELNNQLDTLTNDIQNLQNEITILQETIAELEGHAPIELEFIDNLEPYNSQEGVG